MSSKTPSDEEIEDKFEELVKSGIDFLTRAASELESDSKYSVIHFATGLEILLKARVFAEHWSLVAKSPHSCTWSGLVSGDENTIGAETLYETLQKKTDTVLSDTQQDAFEEVREHRNRVVHWLPNEDLASIEAEQCRASHHLLKLLKSDWDEFFSDFSAELQDVEDDLLNNRKYLQARYDDLEDRLKGPENHGRLIECPACDFRAGVIEPWETNEETDEAKEAIFTEFSCWVCYFEDLACKFSCDHWLPLNELPQECRCGSEHELVDFLQRDDLGELLRTAILDSMESDLPRSQDEEQLMESPTARCGECFAIEETVKPTGEPHEGVEYICVRCAARFSVDDLGSCEWCNANWAGVNLTESASIGCDNCDGLIGHHM